MSAINQCNHQNKPPPVAICNTQKQDEINERFYVRTFPSPDEIPPRPLDMRPKFRICTDFNRGEYLPEEEVPEFTSNPRDIVRTPFVPTGGIGPALFKQALVDNESYMRRLHLHLTECPEEKHLPCRPLKTQKYEPKYSCDAGGTHAPAYWVDQFPQNVQKCIPDTSRYPSRICEGPPGIKRETIIPYTTRNTPSTCMRVGPNRCDHSCENLFNNMTKQAIKDPRLPLKYK